MAIIIRTSTVQPGKLFEYLEAAKHTIAVANRVTGVEFKLATSFGRNVNEVAVIGSFASVADLEAAGKKLVADAEWRAATTASQSLVVPGSTQDHVWTEV